MVLEQPQANVFRYTFRSEQPLDEVYTFYHEMFMEQNFERTSGELGESGGEFTYTQNGAEIGFTIESVDEDRYEVVYDLQGLAAEQAAAN